MITTVSSIIVALALQGGDALTEAPPVIKGPEKQCVCPEGDTSKYLTLSGLVIDAEMTLGADGRSVNERQTTIFDVKPVKLDGKSIFGRTRIWHTTSLESCGVTFDYGKQYSVPVRKTDDGQYETDLCLMKRAGLKS